MMLLAMQPLLFYAFNMFSLLVNMFSLLVNMFSLLLLVTAALASAQ